ncbi:hypothetical protein MTP99_001830 [Tenebrio molitor]|nr:hypothetical protein MTP99_001830 [Tenebrio molitor]
MKYIATFIICFVLVWATPLQKSPLKKVPAKDIDSRIIDGDLAVLGQFPWQVALYITHASTIQFRCSGSIISEQWILTTASNIYGFDSVTVVAGVVDLNGSGVLTQSSEVIPYYDFNPPKNVVHNIGLIRLSTPLTFNRYVAAITLADNLLEDGADVTISGWGATSSHSDDDSTQHLYYADLVTIRNSECSAIYGNILESTVVCAGPGTDSVKNACYDDSGDPLVLDVNTNPVHVGLLSSLGSLNCESGIPSGFIRTAFFRNWIRDVTGV